MTVKTRWGFLAICFALMVCCFIYDIFVPRPQSEQHEHVKTSPAIAPTAQDDTKAKVKKYLFQSMIQARGYTCDSVDKLQPCFSGGYTVYCNGWRYEYRLKDVGGRGKVTVE